MTGNRTSIAAFDQRLLLSEEKPLSDASCSSAFLLLLEVEEEVAAAVETRTKLLTSLGQTAAAATAAFDLSSLTVVRMPPGKVREMPPL